MEIVNFVIFVCSWFFFVGVAGCEGLGVTLGLLVLYLVTVWYSTSSISTFGIMVSIIGIVAGSASGMGSILVTHTEFALAGFDVFPVRFFQLTNLSVFRFLKRLAFDPQMPFLFKHRNFLSFYLNL